MKRYRAVFRHTVYKSSSHRCLRTAAVVWFLKFKRLSLIGYQWRKLTLLTHKQNRHWAWRSTFRCLLPICLEMGSVQHVCLTPRAELSATPQNAPGPDLPSLSTQTTAAWQTQVLSGSSSLNCMFRFNCSRLCPIFLQKAFLPVGDPLRERNTNKCLLLSLSTTV